MNAAHMKLIQQITPSIIQTSHIPVQNIISITVTNPIPNRNIIQQEKEAV